MTKDEIFQLRVAIESTIDQMKTGLIRFVEYGSHLMVLVNRLEREIPEKDTLAPKESEVKDVLET